MKNRIIILLISVFVFAADEISAQDIHFTQYNASPLNLNPALAGLNSCRYRLSGNVRMQYGNASVSQFVYKTANVSYDMSIAKAYKYKNFFGFGFNFYTDVSGDINYATHKLDLALAYHILLNKYATSTLSIGIMGGLGYKSIDLSKVTLDEQYDGYDFNPGGRQEVLDRNNFLYGDISAGALWSMNRRVSGKTNDYNFYNNYYLGFAFYHLNQPRLVFYQNNPTRQYTKFVFHGGGQILLKGKLSMMPSFMFLRQGTNQLNLGTYMRYKLGYLPVDKMAIYLGVFARINNQFDAIAPAIRFDYNKLQIGFSYDINVSKFSPGSGTIGGPELSIVYGGCFGKKTRVQFCPQL